MTARAASSVSKGMTDDQNVPFEPQQADATPAGDTPEHSDAAEGAEGAAQGRRPRTEHVGNALGGEGEGSSPGGAPRRHVKRPAATPQRA